MSYVLAIDEGTTGVRAHIFDASSAVIGAAYQEIGVSYPQAGWMEQDPIEIWQATRAVCARALQAARLQAGDIAAIGVCNQRSSTVVWERATGKPIYPAIGWQDLRSVKRIPQLVCAGVFTTVFSSAAKLEWILQSAPDLVQRAARREILFGTIDTWLVWNLSGGAAHVTDHSNASSTTFYDLMQGCWHQHALAVLNVPNQMLPTICSSSQVVGLSTVAAFGAEVPIAGMAGDQQAALFGELGIEKGAVKMTLGTSAMADVNTGASPVISKRGVYPNVLWGLNGQLTYSLEGTVVSTGAAVQWLRDGLGILGSVEECGALAGSVPDSGGVWAVPAFQGLGTPYSDANARAVIGGLSRASTRAHVVRAVLEGIGYRSREVLDTLLEEIGAAPPARLRVDGGAAANDFLLQHLADVLGYPVERPQSVQASALGAAYLAGLAVGVWKDTDQLRSAWRSGGVFEPRWHADQRDSIFCAWQKTIAATNLVVGLDSWHGGARERTLP